MGIIHVLRSGTDPVTEQVLQGVEQNKKKSAKLQSKILLKLSDLLIMDTMNIVYIQIIIHYPFTVMISCKTFAS